MLGRKLRCRLDLLYKSDDEVVRERQVKSIQNYNGSKDKVFKEGDEVMIKYYKPGSKESWLKATINKVLGTKRYECVARDDKTYIRHVDQIINATIIETETPTQESVNGDVSVTDRIDDKKKRTKKFPCRLKDFIVN